MQSLQYGSTTSTCLSQLRLLPGQTAWHVLSWVLCLSCLSEHVDVDRGSRGFVEAWQPLQQPLIYCAGVTKVLSSICGNKLRPNTAPHSIAGQSTTTHPADGVRWLQLLLVLSICLHPIVS